jgi:hypothetical protein
MAGVLYRWHSSIGGGNAHRAGPLPGSILVTKVSVKSIGGSSRDDDQNHARDQNASSLGRCAHCAPRTMPGRQLARFWPRTFRSLFPAGARK